MRNFEWEGSFRKDLKRIGKRGWNRAKLDEIVAMLRANTPLPLHARAHKLSGEWTGYWECHVSSNWLFIYKITDTAIRGARTGTHADLFGE